MLPMIPFEVIRQMNEERVAKATRSHWLRHAAPDAIVSKPPSQRDADVIELVFGAACEVEDAIA